MRTWVDTEAFKNPAWCWFTAAVAFMFFGFYPVFFNLEEVNFPLIWEASSANNG
jgi:MCP family monocarboxylic acid transporter-like MFS transporter 10